MFDQSKVRFNEAGLVPAVAQDALSGEVLMLAYICLLYTSSSWGRMGRFLG